MDEQPNLSSDFNKKLVSKLKRNITIKSLFSITIISFLKSFLSIFSVFFHVLDKNKNVTNDKTIDEKI